MWQEREDNSLDSILTNQFGREERKPRNEGEKRRDFRESVSTFSLDFLVIGQSNSGKTRGKFDPHCKGYAWIPILWSLDNSER